MSDGKKITNGCMVTVGHYQFYTQDFYPVVLEKLSQVGTMVAEMVEGLSEDHKCHKKGWFR